MATSGTNSFTLQVDEAIREAYDRLGIASPTGYQLKRGRRVLNMLLQELSNRWHWMHKTESDTLTTTASQASETLSSEIVDIKDVTITLTSGAEVMLTRFSQSDYASQPNKSQTGRPVGYYLDRQLSGHVMYLWPVPDDTYTITFYKSSRMFDVGDYTNTLDVPVRAEPAIVSGLAYNLSDSDMVDANRRIELKQRYEEEVNRAIDEDGESVTLRLVPKLRRH